MSRMQIQSDAEIIEAVSAARANGSTLEIVGSGTKRGYGRHCAADAVLDISALTGIVSYEPDELVITAKTGTLISEIEDALARRGQRLGFDPADWGPLFGKPRCAATVGGVLSADACGSARVRFGAARDHLLGYRAINGFAESYKAGGRVVKNVTGFDLPKLLCGAMGTLGVLTEVTLRLVPRPPHNVTLIARDIAPDDGFALLRRAWTSAFGPTGLAYVPSSVALSFTGFGAVGEGAALMRLEGAPVPLAEKIAGLRALDPGALLEEIDGERTFREIGNGHALVGMDADVWRVVLPPSASARFVAEQQPDIWVGDWAGGLLWIGSAPDDEAAAQKIRSLASACDGHAILLRASETMRSRIPPFRPESPTCTAVSKSVKAAFDPFGIFNPSRMYEGI